MAKEGEGPNSHWQRNDLSIKKPINPYQGDPRFKDKNFFIKEKREM